MSEMASESLLNFVGKYAKNGREVAVCQRRGYRMESWSYARIAGQANRLARELEVRGLGKGDAALLWGHNSAEWIVAFLGCVLRGVVVVPIDHVRLRSSRSALLERLKQGSHFEPMRIGTLTQFLPFLLSLLGKRLQDTMPRFIHRLDCRVKTH